MYETFSRMYYENITGKDSSETRQINPDEA